jgi:hypothetical protein
MRRFLLLALLCATGRSVPAAPAQETTPTPADTYTVECDFTNPAYSGSCLVSEETPVGLSPRSACRRVLSCLNNPRCVSKTYCNATAIRGGWRLTEARRAQRGAP